jgi:NAD(P)-dependent dehydrogenase (short-subunit alcohol dehydrogenase family)
MDKGRQAIRQLRIETACDEKNLRLMECDLSSFDSVRKFAQLYNSEEDRLDVLICNAGLVYTPDIYCKDGLNYVMQANYLGHFLLTNLLLDKLKQCRPSRIINVSSSAHQCKKKKEKVKLSRFFVDPPTTEGLPALTNFKTDAMWGSYCPSKACQILSSYKLKHDLRGNVLVCSL